MYTVNISSKKQHIQSFSIFHFCHRHRADDTNDIQYVNNQFSMASKVSIKSPSRWLPTSINFVIQFNHQWHFTCTIPWSTIVLHLLQNSTPRHGKCDELTDIHRWISADIWSMSGTFQHSHVNQCFSTFITYKYVLPNYKFTNVFQLSHSYQLFEMLLRACSDLSISTLSSKSL